MNDDFKVFDFHRIFFGDTPYLYLLEIVFRTVIMYLYCITLLRILGKRGMGQLSTLELAIILCFGSAVGDPMMGKDVPIIHGFVAITVVTFLQIMLERVINKSKKMEQVMEGTANCVVDNGMIKLDCLKADNLSQEDLFRSLRSKDVEHLGQVNKAFFETSGQVSVIFNSPKKIKPGLSVLPVDEVPEVTKLSVDQKAVDSLIYSCATCGFSKKVDENQSPGTCKNCQGETWQKAVVE